MNYEVRIMQLIVIICMLQFVRKYSVNCMKHACCMHTITLGREGDDPRIDSLIPSLLQRMVTMYGIPITRVSGIQLSILQ